MKTNHFIKYSIIISSFAILLNSCSKDEESDSPDSYISSFTQEINADSLASYVNWLQSMKTRFMLADNHRSVAFQIKNRFIEMGYTDTRIDSFKNICTFKQVVYQTWQYNVIATLNGSTYPDSICIIGAHYDNYSKNSDPFISAPGANDNASGIAATLEIARVMQNKNFIPKTTIQFVAFAAEELGLLGSRDYASKIQKVKMMLNNDMIAFWSGTDPSLWTVNIADYTNSTSLRMNAQRICSLYTNLKTNNNNQYNKQSDSYSFYLNGYKAIFFESNGVDNYYHTASDITSNCNFNYLKEVVKVSCALLVDGNKL